MEYLLDLHCHTVASGHAYSTIQENVKAAEDRGLKVLGIADHAPAMPGGAHLYYFLNLKVIPKEINGIRILKGVEANIVDYDGKLDMPDEVLGKLDYAIASLHPPCLKSGSRDENTSAVIGAMNNPYVRVIGHPDDSRFPLDYEKVVQAAKEYDTLLEVNNSSLNPNSFREGALENVKNMLELCKKYGVKIILGSDAHISYSVGDFSNCIKILEEVHFPKELIINYNLEDFRKAFNLD